MEHEDRLVNVQELADYLDVPVKTLYAWRYRREGPRRSESAAISGTAGAMSSDGSNVASKRIVRPGVIGPG